MAIQAAHVRAGQIYGPERLQAEFRYGGFLVGVRSIRQLWKKLDLGCTQVCRVHDHNGAKHLLLVGRA
ncbi:transposase (fragment) [Candidatus Nitrospira nitrosa]|uniref:Transposase n=1 Tax=Candidatus Nitrospira nitrosa TaxID=1742972 RepID=A0A0S4LQ87_9BACT